MTKYKIGDRVKIIEAVNKEFNGKEGYTFKDFGEGGNILVKVGKTVVVATKVQFLDDLYFYEYKYHHLLPKKTVKKEKKECKHKWTIRDLRSDERESLARLNSNGISTLNFIAVCQKCLEKKYI